MQKKRRVTLSVAVLSLFSLLMVAASSVMAQPRLEQIWSADQVQLPNSVYVYRDGRNAFLLVSQLGALNSKLEGQGAIAKVSMDGVLENREWITGLNAPKGMAAREGKLYVADINQIVVIDVKKAEIESRILVPGAVALSDLTMSGVGTLYAADSKTGKVYRIVKTAVDEYLPKVDNANAVKTIVNTLVVGAGTHLYLFDKDKHQMQIASGFARPINGVESINRGDFLVSCAEGPLYYVHLDGRLEMLLDLSAEKNTLANIGFDASSNTLLVPHLAQNSVTAYKVSVN